jgi:uncharacterized protein (TIGR02118 family)
MFKLVALISAKPELSREAFIDYYESNHAPLVRRLLPTIDGYRRNYLTPGLVPGREADENFDVITELTFTDQAALDEFWETIRRPEVIAAIREDEANFIQSDRTRMLGVQEFVSDRRGERG